MLILATSLRELRYGELMRIYGDSMADAASDWPDLPRGLALTLAEQDYYQYLKDVFFPESHGLCAVWEADGRYVSALRLEPYRDGVLLSGLETAPDCRGKGYAKLLIRGVQSQSGFRKIYSHVHKKNLPSLKTHEACGFRIHSDRAVYISGSVDCRSYTLLYEA